MNATHVGDRDRVPSSWFQPWLAACIRGVNQKTQPLQELVIFSVQTYSSICVAVCHVQKRFGATGCRGSWLTSLDRLGAFWLHPQAQCRFHFTKHVALPVW